MTAINGKSKSLEILEKMNGDPLTIAVLLRSIREAEDWSQVEMASRLGISKSQLCDIENDRKTVSPERAHKFARILGYSKKQFVKLALQKILDDAGIRMTAKVS